MEVKAFPYPAEEGCNLFGAEVADASLVGVVHLFAGREASGLDVESHFPVGIAEGHAFGSQAVDFFDGEDEVVARVVQYVLVHFEAADDVGCHLQALPQLLEGGQEDFLDDLQVAEVAAWQVVHDECHLSGQGLQLVALGACQFEDVGVLLVWHDAGAGGAFLRELDEAEVLAIEETGVEGQFAHCPRYAGQGEADVAFRLAASHLCIDHVVVEGIEAEQLGCHGAVQGERRAVACRRAEGVAVGDAVGSLQHDEVIDEAFRVGTQPEAEAAGHGYLQVGVAGHEDVLVALALPLQFGEECLHVLGHEAQLLADEEFQIDQHLVVAAASGVYLLAHVAEPTGEQQFDLRVHVFYVVLDDEPSFPYLGEDVPQLGQQRL